MSGAVLTKLRALIGEGLNTANWGEYVNWRSRMAEFLRGSFAGTEWKEFSDLRSDDASWWGEGRGRQIGMLDSLEARLSATEEAMEGLARSQPAAVAAAVSALQSNRVFLVHGHDELAKEAVARYLEKLGLEAVILHEQANEGRTLIDKFEKHANVAFAVVLLTPDDLGGEALDPEGEEVPDLSLRARQNVVFELGYFVGRLTRQRVCALYKDGVELPSDFRGVLYVELDEKGAWRTKLAQELSNALLPIDLAGLLNS